jgi:hypothetical protein
MKRILFLLALLCLDKALHAQYIYTIKADSVKITNSCDTAELIIENHTQTVPGFLFNKGKGRTEFRRGMQRLSDSLFVFGADTLRMNPWLQGGNRFGTTGVFGTLDDNPIDYYTNNTFRGRWANNGNFIIGSATDEGSRFQVRGTAGISINPNLSRPGDRIRIGGFINTTDGQNILFGTSRDNGATYKNVLVERDGSIGLGTGAPFSWTVGDPLVRCFPEGHLSFMAHRMYFGNTPGPWNASALITAVSDTSEWRFESNYPNGKNYYYFGTQLYGNFSGYVRAPLWIGGRELKFLSGAIDGEAMRITESRNVLIGKTTDDGRRLQVAGKAAVTEEIHVGTDPYYISVKPAYGNGYADNVDASLISFGNTYGSIGVNKQTFGAIPANSLILGHVSTGSVIATTDYRGNPTFVSGADGKVYINGGYAGIRNTATGATGFDVNAKAFDLTITGGLGTGAGEPGDIRFYTGNSQASGTTVHTMTNRWYIKGGTGYLSNSTQPTSMVDVTGSNGYSQLRLRNSYTPTSTSDTNGAVGDVSWDDNYFYIKTSSGWKRSALSTF